MLASRSGPYKTPGETVLHSSYPNRTYWLYDFRAAVQTARKEWGLCDDEIQKLAEKLGRQPTKREIAIQAVKNDIKYLRGWLNDDWHWCGYTVEIYRGDERCHDFRHLEDSLWGIESTSQKDYEAELVETVKKGIDEELAAVEDAAFRDIITVP